MAKYLFICFPNQMFARSRQIFKDDVNNFSSSLDIYGAHSLNLSKFKEPRNRFLLPGYMGWWNKIFGINSWGYLNVEKFGLWSPGVGYCCVLMSNIPSHGTEIHFLTFFKSTVFPSPNFLRTDFGKTNLKRGILWTLCTE